MILSEIEYGIHFLLIIGGVIFALMLLWQYKQASTRVGRFFALIAFVGVSTIVVPLLVVGLEYNNTHPHIVLVFFHLPLLALLGFVISTCLALFVYAATRSPRYDIVENEEENSSPEQKCLWCEELVVPVNDFCPSCDRPV
jgi:hypothetical protein